MTISRLLCVLLFAAASASAQDPPLNVVLFLVDDLGWTDLGCQGSAYYETPAIDRLAAEGMRFLAAYANAPNCAPSRASLLTGRDVPRHGIYTVGSPERGAARDRKLVPPTSLTALRPGVLPTLAHVLGDRGYQTVSIGKWHLGAGPNRQGFELAVAGNRAGHSYGGHFSPYKNRNLPDGPRGEYLADRLTDEASAFLRRRGRQPFFLYLSHYGVHTPIQGKPELVEKFLDKPAAGGHHDPRYAAMIASIDESLARLRAVLEEVGVAERTLILFFSDNGGYGPVTSAAPLRGAKGMLYEGGIRVPLIVHLPGRVKPGVCTTPVLGSDLMPTVLDLVGIPEAQRPETDGASLRPLLEAGRAPQLESRPLFWHFPAYLEAASKEEGLWRTTPAAAVRRGPHKLIEFFEDGRRELYDLEADPGETRDLSEERSELVAELAGLMISWREGTGAPVPTEINPAWVDPAASAEPAPAASSTAAANSRPDVLHVMAEGLALEDLLSLDVATHPNLASLVAEGRLFRAHRAGAPSAAPARCVVLTGRHTGNAAIRDAEIRPEAPDVALPRGTLTLPGLLRAAGHRTGLFGRWGLGGLGTSGLPGLQGFDRFLGILESRGGRTPEAERLVADDRLAPLAADADLPEAILSGAEGFLRDAEPGRPLYLLHASADPGPAGPGRARRLARLDAHLGRLRAAARGRREGREPIVVLSSCPTPSPGGSGTLRRGGLFEGELRSPLLLSWTGRIAPGATDLVSAAQDLLPTILDLSGLAPPEGLDGISLAAELLGRGAPPRREHLYWESERRRQAVLLEGRWKGVREHPRRPVELYDLETDPGETRNLASTKPELVARVTALMASSRTESARYPLTR